MESLKEQIDRLDREITEKQGQLNGLNGRMRGLVVGEPRAIAETIHESECHSNHTDGCSWFYEKWEEAERGQGYAKTRYLAAAKTLIEWAAENALPLDKVVEARTMRLA